MPEAHEATSEVGSYHFVEINKVVTLGSGS
jgi:hypothetical protein